jgi:uncharacterized protein (TIGR02231 family)
MKSIIIASALLIGASMLSAQPIEVRPNSTITHVTVFTGQAQITRSAKVNLSAGITQVVFDRVSPYINLNSIQVKTENTVSLMSVSHRNNYLVDENKSRFILELEDTLSKLNNQMELLRIRGEGFKLEREVLLANKQIGGENTGVKIDDLEDALVLYRKRSIEIGEELLKLDAQTNRLKGIHKKFKQQLDAYLKNNSTIEVVITLKTLSAVNNTKIEWSYLVSNAGWTPFYDIRVKDTKSPLQLVSKAYITQNTMEDWNNVILKLSTTNPNETGLKPELFPIYLNIQQPVMRQEEINTIRKRKASVQGTPAVLNDNEAMALAYSEGIAYVEQTDINMEFNVTSAYSIPSDRNPHQVDLSISNIAALYRYSAAPKLDKHAYVTATVSANEIGTLPAGEANVYFDGTFIGKTILQPATNDSIRISLGRDKRIQIQRVQLSDFSTRSISGSTKREINSWEITVRNTLKETITLVIEDQIPVSGTKDVEVRLTNNGGANFDETTGKLTWELKPEAEKSQTLRFSFEVRYPKDKFVSPY